jgi:hypothetical protein
VSWEARRTLLIAISVVVLTALIWIVMWAVTYSDRQAETCESLGGHQYSRQFGKTTYYKCVTDDNRVILT